MNLGHRGPFLQLIPIKAVIQPLRFREEPKTNLILSALLDNAMTVLYVNLLIIGRNIESGVLCAAPENL
jgi:hypothetical protein